MERYSFKKIDIVSMTPSNPNKEAFRKKLLDEHTHSETEVRYFVDGSAAFYLHLVERKEIVRIECSKGHILTVPANTKHWFDMGANPYFKVIRFFGTDDGWIAQYTGDQISKKFPLYLNWNS